MCMSAVRVKELRCQQDRGTRPRPPARAAHAQSGPLAQLNSFAHRNSSTLKVCANFLVFLFLLELLCGHVCIWEVESNLYCVSDNNDAEEESDEDEDYVPSEDWKKVRQNLHVSDCWLVTLYI